MMHALYHYNAIIAIHIKKGGNYIENYATSKILTPYLTFGKEHKYNTKPFLAIKLKMHIFFTAVSMFK